MKRTSIRRRYRYTGPGEETLAIVAARSNGVCEFPHCTHPAQDPHHRYERGMGGVGPKGPDWINEVCNIMAACRYHNDWCSNQQPYEAWQMGWLLKDGELPWQTPVAMNGGMYVLDNSGRCAIYEAE